MPKYPGSYEAGRATSHEVKNSPRWEEGRRERRKDRLAEELLCWGAAMPQPLWLAAFLPEMLRGS